MTINWKDFDEKYPGLAGELAGYFHETETVDDESNARNLRADLSDADRIDLLIELLGDAHKLMANMDEDWQVMVANANRRIYNVDDARSWLKLIMDVWQEELARLQGGAPES